MSDSNASNKTGLKGILSFFGIKDQAPVTTDQIDYKNMVPTRYTPEDMGQIHKMMLSHTDGGQKTQDISFHAALNEFNIIQQRTAMRKADNSNIKQVAPEVAQASNITASAIFNPNDMQDGSYTFHCDTELISEEARVLIVQALSDYFNDRQKLAIHHHEMVKDILYMSGARPVLILPTTALADMIDKSVVGIESIDPKKKHLKRESVWDMAADPNKSLFGMNTAHRNIGLENLNIYDDDLGNEFSETLVESIALEMFEEERTRNPKSTKALDDIKSSVNRTQLKAGLEEMSKKLIEDLESGKSIRTTDRLELLGLLGIKTERAQKEQTKKVRSYFSTPNRVIHQPFIELSPDQSVEETFHPIVVDLPVESVIPVFVPGSPNKHIGYFVIQDELGNPINNYSYIQDQATQPSLSKESVQAFFGKMGDNNSSIGAIQKNAAKHLYKNETIHKVFNSVFDKYIQTHMQKTGVPAIDTSVTEAVSKCMMVRFFRRAKTTLVYVPKEHLIYYAFDYHDDGTGKSLVDDIQYVLSIRVMLTVASMLSAVKNAVDKTVLSIDYGKHISNPRAITETLRQVFTDGKKTTFTYDPVMATQDIQREAVKIIPANVEGLTTYKVDTDNRSSSKIEADTDFMSKLDEMMIYALGVPHADMNHLSKDEYSRSVATRNILFAKEIIRKAATLCSHVDDYIRVYTRYSGPLRKAIAAACEDRLTSSGTEGGEDVIDRIIDSIWVSLPKPNIAVDKAQYTEIREAIEIIETLIDKIYPDECAPGDYSNEMRMIRATVKSHKLREIISTIGASSNVTSMPKLDEILDLSDINKIHMTVKNLKTMLERLEKAFEPKEESTDSSYSSDSDDSSGSGDGDPESAWGGDSGDNEETPEGDDVGDSTPEEESSEEPEETDPEQSWGDNEEHVDDEPDKSEWSEDDETSDKPTKSKKKESEEDPSTSWE